MAAPSTSTSNTSALPSFVYDDVCPLCRGYTAIFSTLGWADRQAFSTIDDDALAALDMDRARHEIPLYDATTNTVRYGLDGILPILARRLVPLAPAIRAPITRRLLDRAYWLITYNRRHIVSSAPPPAGAVDCAPDHNPRAIATYVGLAAATTVGAATVAGTTIPVAAVAATSGAAIATRPPASGVDDGAAAGHVATITTASALAGLAVRAFGGRPVVAGAATLGVGARKLFLRRWMLATPPG